MPETILVVEDEPALQETLAYNLKNSGCAVETAADGHAGIEVARTVRKEMSSGIIMVTARSDDWSKRAAPFLTRRQLVPIGGQIHSAEISL